MSVKIAIKFFENVAKFKLFGTITKENSIHGEIKEQPEVG
jgi:hypothetical protein